MVADTDSVVARGDTVPRDTTVRDTTVSDASAVQDTTRARGAFPDPDGFFKELANRSGFRVVEYRGKDVHLDLDEQSVAWMGRRRRSMRRPFSTPRRFPTGSLSSSSVRAARSSWSAKTGR